VLARITGMFDPQRLDYRSAEQITTRGIEYRTKISDDAGFQQDICKIIREIGGLSITVAFSSLYEHGVLRLGGRGARTTMR